MSEQVTPAEKRGYGRSQNKQEQKIGLAAKAGPPVPFHIPGFVVHASVTFVTLAKVIPVCVGGPGVGVGVGVSTRQLTYTTVSITLILLIV